ncbi:MAG: hypothetical protein HQL32_09510 [Planctomycetes bacterium]|nr:hypothetical protein [Planctomycetota bacterium]
MYLASSPFIVGGLFVIFVNIYRFEIVPFVISSICALIMLGLGGYCFNMGRKCKSFPLKVLVHEEQVEIVNQVGSEIFQLKDITTLCFDHIVSKSIGYEVMIRIGAEATHTLAFSRKYKELIDLFIDLSKSIKPNSTLLFRIVPGGELYSDKVSKLSSELGELTNKYYERQEAPQI